MNGVLEDFFFQRILLLTSKEYPGKLPEHFSRGSFEESYVGFSTLILLESFLMKSV